MLFFSAVEPMINSDKDKVACLRKLISHSFNIHSFIKRSIYEKLDNIQSKYKLFFIYSKLNVFMIKNHDIDIDNDAVLITWL